MEVACGRGCRGQGWTGRKALNTKDRLHKITEIRRDHGPVMDSTQTVTRSVSALETEEGRFTLDVGGIPGMESSGAAPPGFLATGICDQLPGPLLPSCPPCSDGLYPQTASQN